MNRRMKNRLSTGLERTSVLRAAEWLSGPTAAILALHRVLPCDEERSSYNSHIVIEESCFEALLQWLTEEWRIVPISDLLRLDIRREGRNCCAVTFDDGWEDNYRIAFPILQQYRIPATVFVPTGYLGTSNWLPEERLARLVQRCKADRRQQELTMYSRNLLGDKGEDKQNGSALSKTMKQLPLNEKMSILQQLETRFGRAEPPLSPFINWTQVREMEDAGITFGSHTVRHCLLATETDETVRKELGASMEMLRQKLKAPSNILAYPNGSYDSRVVSLAAEIGYEAAVTTEIGTVTRSTDPFRLPRIPIDSASVCDEAGRFSRARTRLHILRARPVKHVPAVLQRGK